MFNSDLSQLFKPLPDGRYNDMEENMDIMLNYDNNELMSSDFFDTIRSVENDIQNDYFNNSVDDFNALSDNSSLLEGNTSPESERSTGYTEFTDESIFPTSTTDSSDDALFELLGTNNTEIKLQTTPVIINQQKPSKIIIQNPINKKFIDKQLVNATPMKKIGKKQIVKVQQLTTSDGKPVILPYGLKSIKIVNASDLKNDRIQVTSIPTQKIHKLHPQQARVQPQQRPKVERDASIPTHELSEVKLTSEEKRLLDKEGIRLPAYHPLTKMEDRELKRIRRKIRNKISAQDSRKRKKEYVDGLEERVRRGSEENRNLMQRIKELQKTNKTLMAHINKLQSLIFNTSSTKATPSTCLMIVMLSILLVSLPNIKLNQMVNNELTTMDNEQITTSRTLLSTKPIDDENFNMDEFFVFNRDDESIDNENNTEEFFKNIEEAEQKYTRKFDSSDDNMLNTFFNNIKKLFDKNIIGAACTDYGGFMNKNGFIEPDIDDGPPEQPPLKRMRLIDENEETNTIISTTVQTKIRSEDK